MGHDIHTFLHLQRRPWRRWLRQWQRRCRRRGRGRERSGGRRRRRRSYTQWSKKERARWGGTDRISLHHLVPIHSWRRNKAWVRERERGKAKTFLPTSIKQSKIHYSTQEPNLDNWKWYLECTSLWTSKVYSHSYIHSSIYMVNKNFNKVYALRTL